MNKPFFYSKLYIQELNDIVSKTDISSDNHKRFITILEDIHYDFTTLIGIVFPQLDLIQSISTNSVAIIAKKNYLDFKQHLEKNNVDLNKDNANYRSLFIAKVIYLFCEKYNNSQYKTPSLPDNLPYQQKYSIELSQFRLVSVLISNLIICQEFLDNELQIFSNQSLKLFPKNDPNYASVEQHIIWLDFVINELKDIIHNEIFGLN
jgi:hypothetical protein